MANDEPLPDGIQGEIPLDAQASAPDIDPKLQQKIDETRSKIKHDAEWALLSIKNIANDESTRPVALSLLAEFFERNQIAKGTKQEEHLGWFFSKEEIEDAATQAAVSIITKESEFRSQAHSTRLEDVLWLIRIYNLAEVPEHAEKIKKAIEEHLVAYLQTIATDFYATIEMSKYMDVMSAVRGFTTEWYEGVWMSGVEKAIEGQFAKMRELEGHEFGYGLYSYVERAVELGKQRKEIPPKLLKEAASLMSLAVCTEEGKEFVKVFEIQEEIVKKAAVSHVSEYLKGHLGVDQSGIKYAANFAKEWNIEYGSFSEAAENSLRRVLEAGNVHFLPDYFRAFPAMDPEILNVDPYYTLLKVELEKRAKADSGDYSDAENAQWRKLVQARAVCEVLDAELSRNLDSPNKDVIFSQSFEKNEFFPSGMPLSDSTKQKFRLRAIAELEKGSWETFVWSKKFGELLTPEELRNSAIKGLCNRAARERNIWNFSDTNRITKITEYLESLGLPAELAQEPVVVDTARLRLFEEIRAGASEEVKLIRDFWNLHSICESPEGKAAAGQGFMNLMKDEYSSAMKAMELCKICKLEDRVVGVLLKQVMDEDNVEPVLNGIDMFPEKALAYSNDEYYLLSYKQDLGVPAYHIYTEYVGHARSGNAIGLQGYVQQLKNTLEGLVSSEEQSSEITKQPHYKELVEAVFPNNAGQWTNFESNESCLDRTEDLRKYTVRPNYNFNISPGVDMQLKGGLSEDESALEKVQKSVQRVQVDYQGVDFDPEQMLTKLDEKLDEKCSTIKGLDAFEKREEKLFALMLETLVGGMSEEQMKEMIISYQFAEFQDIRAYLQGTRDRAEQAKNPRYAYLIELREFFADRLKDVSRKISDIALSNPRFAELLPQYFTQKSKVERERLSQESLNKLQVDKLGLSPSFLTQISRTLKARTGKDHTNDEVRQMIAEYEQRMNSGAEGIELDANLDPAIAGQIRTQRSKTIRALEVLKGTNVNPAEIYLGEINLQQQIEQQQNMQSGEYNEELFSAYLAQSIQNLYLSELSTIDTELNKYEAANQEKEDVRLRKVEAFISLNHTSAHARATAGVCVSGNNPDKKDQNDLRPCLWEMPNYLQLVLRDAETKVCQGCVLLHVEEQAGQKVLIASLNPCSTYLFKVNEAEMFQQLRSQLIAFAEDNDFDAVGVSANQQIRTNRTGGEFENSMNAAIRNTNKKIILKPARLFSTNPVYEQDDIDLIWAKQTVEASVEEFI